MVGDSGSGKLALPGQETAMGTATLSVAARSVAVLLEK